MLAWLKRGLAASKPRADVYGLDHAVLNVRVPPESMWMNMGYWEHTSDFPEACQALLDQVLEAGLLADEESLRARVRVVDVGCGCGDQSLHILQLNKNSHSHVSRLGSGIDAASSSGPVSAADAEKKINLRSRHNAINRQDIPAGRLVYSYIGITLEPAQAALARQRVREACQNKGGEDSSTGLPAAEIFCADAANPTSWTGDLQQAMTTLAASSSSSSPSPSAAAEKEENEKEDISTWLLALDTMYHFRPSRLPLLHYAHSTLHSSLMAFDLVLSENISWHQHLLLWVVCWMTGSPIANFVSGAEYKNLLVQAGYKPAHIQITDISRHVFPGLSSFLDIRVKQAQPFGFRLGKFRAARMVFEWWARKSVVRGVVVVARR